MSDDNNNYDETVEEPLDIDDIIGDFERDLIFDDEEEDVDNEDRIDISSIDGMIILFKPLEILFYVM